MGVHSSNQRPFIGCRLARCCSEDYLKIVLKDGKEITLDWVPSADKNLMIVLRRSSIRVLCSIFSLEISADFSG